MGTHGNCPTKVASLEQQLSNRSLAGFEATIAAEATLHNESFKVAETIKDDFFDLSCTMLLLDGVRTFLGADR